MKQNKAHIDRLYEYLANEEDARVCKEISEKACREVPGNFFIILLSQCLTKLGDALASTKIVLPWVMTQSGVPAFFTGLLVPIRESGSLLPQLVLGSVIRKYAMRKGFFVFGCVLQAACVAGMAWSVFALRGSEAGIMIILMLVIFSLARGVCSVSSKDVLGKTIPKTRRGRLSGLAASISGLITLGIAFALWFDMLNNQQQGYLLLCAAAIMWVIAAMLFSQVKEFPGATEGGGNALREAFKRLSILKEDQAFRNFVIVRALLMSTGLSAPFLIILAQSGNETGSVAQLSLFIGVSGFASLISGSVWGRFSDDSSRKVMLWTALASAFISLAAAALASQSQSLPVWSVVLLYFVLAVTHQGVRLGRKTYIVDLAEGNKRTDYVAVSNTLIGILLLSGGLLSAIIAQWSLFWVFMLFAGSSLLAWFLGLRLPEA